MRLGVCGLLLIAMLPSSIMSGHRVHRAIERGDNEKVLRLIRAQSFEGIDTPNKRGYTPLMTAVVCGDNEMVALLVERAHANVNAQAPDGSTALMLAIRACRGTVVHADGGDAAHMLAARACNEQIVRYLIEKGRADLAIQDNQGNNALMWAVHDQVMSAILLLAYYGAPINAQNKRGMTALMVAVLNGDLLLVKLLVERYGANISLETVDHESALTLARKSEQQDMYVYLWSHLYFPKISKENDAYDKAAHDGL